MRTFSVSLAFLLVAIASADSGYSIATLTGRPSAINGFGTMTISGPLTDHVYTQTNGVLIDLGVPFAGRFNGGSAINDAGQIVGTSTGSSSTTGERSFRFANGTFSALDPLANGLRARAYGINASGVAVGFSDTAASGTIRPVVWTGSNATPLSLLPGDLTGYALRINDAGTILGSSANNSIRQAVVWRNGALQVVTSPDGQGGVRGLDLNDAGQVLGQSTNGAAFLWQNGASVALGHLGSIDNVQPFDLNDAGVAVGSSSIDAMNFGDPSTAAFLYRNGAMVDLNSFLTPTQRAAYHLDAGLLINDAGQIVVQATTGQWPNSGTALLLLTPNPVPEPATFVALGLGALATLRRRKAPRTRG